MVGGGDQQARSAIAALAGIAGDEGLLQVADLAAVGEASMVSTTAPSRLAAMTRQPRTGSPSRRTVQAPQTPCSQPVWRRQGPSERRKSTRCRRVSTLRDTRSPLTVR